MKVAVANSIREQYVQKLMSLLSDEDLGMIASNSFNFPIVADGEESWVEIVVKIPKEDDGYDKREEYSMKVEDRKAKAEEKAKAKAKKMERDRKMREEKTEAKRKDAEECAKEVLARAKAKAEAEAKGE